MKKALIILISVLSLVYLYKNSMKEEITIPDEAIRFRVIASSNTIYDQNIKKQVKSALQDEIFRLTKDSNSIEETRNILKSNINSLDELTDKTLKKLNYDKKYTINYGYNYFPKKKYKGITYKEGNYESLVIKLGEAKGNNWWCVLFPPLCLMESDENDVSNVEYALLIKEIIKKYTSIK